MKSAKFVGIIGFLVAIVPLTGLPLSWKTTISVLLGLCLMAFSAWKYATIRRARKSHVESHVVTESYVENSPKSNAIVDGGKKV